MGSTSSVNLGLVKAIYVGETAPSNQMIIWADTSAMPENPVVHRYYNSVIEDWVSLGTGEGTTLTSINLGRVLYVSINGSDTLAEVGSLIKTYLTVGAAIAKAKTMSPTAGSRVSIVLFPGNYNEDVSLDSDYIDLIPFTQQGEVFGSFELSQESGADYSILKRKTTLNKLIWSSLNNVVSGIDIKTIEFTPIAPTSEDAVRRRVHNCICETIDVDEYEGTGAYHYATLIDVVAGTCYTIKQNVDIRGDFFRCVFGSMYNYVSEVALEGTISNTQIHCFQVNTLSQSFGFDQTTTSVSRSSFDYCVFKDDTFFRINIVSFNRCKFGSNCIKYSTSSNFENCIFESQCLINFTDTNFKHCSSITTIGESDDMETALSGNLDDFSSDYSNGFCNGRPFKGNLRNMTIRATNPDKPALNIYYVSGVPSNIEFSTILHCDASGSTIVGDQMFLSYCKLNKAYENINILGSPSNSFNVISLDLCSYNPLLVCTPPTSLTLLSVDSTSNLTFRFRADLTTARVGTMVEVTYPDGTVINRIVETGNSDDASTIEFLIILTDDPIKEGNYSFRARTICSFDSAMVPDGVSVWYGPVLGHYATPAPVITWVGTDESKFCVTEYATYGVTEFSPEDGSHNVTRTFDDGTTQMSYNIYDSLMSGVIGPYTVVWTPGDLVSGRQAGIASSAFTELQVIPGTYLGTRVPRNTGMQGWATLVKLIDGTPTSTTKDNSVEDSDYIEPIPNSTDCPIS